VRRRRAAEPRIFFPWESRGGLRRWLGLGRARPFVIALAAIGLVVFLGMRERHDAGVRQTRATLLSVRRAIDAYLAEHEGGCPASLDAVADYGAFKRVPGDAWGRPLRFSCPTGREGAAYELMSDGPDGKPGGLDRIE
jgi:general secretion pathway protein G